jgi:CheY-like chemotaxis protein
MTGKDGNALCRDVRSDEKLAKVAMIASSASVYDGDRRDAESAGFDDFLPKPVKEQDLFRILEQHLRLRWIVKREPRDDSDGTGATQTADSAQQLPVNGRSLSVEKLRELLTLAGEGDVVALRGKLRELSEKNSDCAGFARQLVELVSAYRIEELEILLEQAINETATAPDPGALQGVSESSTAPEPGALQSK